MRLATIPATLWAPPAVRSRIVLYAWFPPTQDEASRGQETTPSTRSGEIACTSGVDLGRSIAG
ncbi:MAG: hypothetical protein ACKVZ0_12770 [Gemmatimonadales bacterium]